MDMSKLALLSTEALIKMQSAVKEILATRLDTTLRVGRVATFVDSQGATRTVHVLRVNQKTVSCVETGISVKPGAKWRCGKAGLSVVPEIRGTPLPMKKPPVSHKPSTDIGDAW